MIYAGALAAFIVSLALVNYLTPRVLLLSLRKKLIDQVADRKVHTAAASRFGGFSFLPAIIIAVCLGTALVYMLDHEAYLASNPVRFIIGCSSLLILYILGVADDTADVRYQTKFFVQLLAVVLTVASGLWINNLHGFCGIYELPAYAGIPLTILLLVFITNSINLIDGIDGLAALSSILALSVYGLIFLDAQALHYSLLAFAALGALIPFFYFNVFGVSRKNDSKIFMGDTGSTIIGFLLGIMAVELWNMETSTGETPYSYLLGYTMLIVPCFDTVRIFLARLIRRRPLFMPDKNHIHHRVMDRGLSPHQALMAIIVAELFFLVANMILARFLNITFIFLIDGILAILLFWYVKTKPY